MPTTNSDQGSKEKGQPQPAPFPQLLPNDTPRVDTHGCGQFFLLQWREGRSRAIRLICKRWSCPECEPKRKRRLRAQALSGQPTTFLTLTSNPAVSHSPEEACRILIDGWRKLARLIKRKFRYDRLPYMVFIEATKKGEPHLHILLRCGYIPQAWLSEQWNNLTGAKIVDIRRITEARGAARYVTKYTSKAPEQFGGGKRYYATQSWRVTERKIAEREFWKLAQACKVECKRWFVVQLFHGDGLEIITATGDLYEARGSPDDKPPWWLSLGLPL